MVTDGLKKFGPINDGFFYKRMYGGFCHAVQKKVAVITR